MIIARRSTQGLLLTLCLFIIGCGSQPEKPTAKTSPLIHQDSTLYFADRTASISMRASFHYQERSVKQPLAEGYQLQLRSISPKNRVIRQLAIITGGQKITLAEEGFLLPPNKGINLSLTLNESLLIHKNGDGILQFKYDGQSQFMRISEHQLIEFTVEP